MRSDFILLALGANIASADCTPPVASLERALAAIASRSGLTLLGRSRWYRSAPVPPSGQPDYVNGAARFAGEVDPVEFLALLHRLEAEAGRVRAEVNAARPLDLDIIGIGDLVRAGPVLTLPHPRAHLRRFVLEPLAEVAADWVHPILGRMPAELAANLPQEDLSLFGSGLSGP